MSALLVRLWRQLTARRRRECSALLVLMLAGSFAEIVSMGAILPFLALIASPANTQAKWIPPQLLTLTAGMSRAEQVLLYATCFGIAAILSGVVRLVLLWASSRFAFGAGADLSVAVLRRTLEQPYVEIIRRHSSELVSGVVTKISGSIVVLYQSLSLLSAIVMMATIAGFLLILSPSATLLAGVTFGGAYVVITRGTHKRLRTNSVHVAEGSTGSIRVLQESIGAIRDVKLDKMKEEYCRLFQVEDAPVRVASGSNMFLGGAPRYVMEAVGMIVFAVLAVWIELRGNGVAQALPILGALAVGAQRLLPILQQAFNAWANIVGNRQLLQDTVEMLEQVPDDDEVGGAREPVAFVHAIALDRVTFKYPGTADTIYALRDVSFRIPRGTWLGVLGPTGSGKSTLLDVLMGLLVPTSGTLQVDGLPITSANRGSWQQYIAHVPQTLFLSSSSIAENVAFGVPADQIDRTLVMECLEAAQLREFVDRSPAGIDMNVGERGSLLSGGQRQRVGLARALYKRPQVLVLDEATSALDPETEHAVLSGLRALREDMTIIQIAHRLEAIRECNLVITFRDGRIANVRPGAAAPASAEHDPYAGVEMHPR